MGSVGLCDYDYEEEEEDDDLRGVRKETRNVTGERGGGGRNGDQNESSAAHLAMGLETMAWTLVYPRMRGHLERVFCRNVVRTPAASISGGFENPWEGPAPSWEWG